jgi:hypothetical protein
VSDLDRPCFLGKVGGYVPTAAIAIDALDAVRSDEQREITVNLSVYRRYPAAGTAVAASRAAWPKPGFCLQIDRSAG